MLLVQWTAPRAQVIAHRGASAAAPEHTDEAFELAVAEGADVLELDVRPTLDGEVVVVHDSTLARTAGDPRRVDALTRRDLAKLPPSVRPLTLDAVLERHASAAPLLLELKDPDPRTEGLVVDAVERHGVGDRVVLQVFDRAALRRLRLRAPGLRLCSLHHRRPSARTLAAVASCATAIGVWHRRVDAGLVAAAHARGLAVNAWTVNSAAAIDEMLAVGVDGVVTDAPDIATGRVFLGRERRPAAAGGPVLATAV